MKAKITWKEHAKVLKVDDTLYDRFPEVGGTIGFRGDRFKVVGIESAVVLVEAIPAVPVVPTPPVPLRKTEEPVVDRKPFKEEHVVRPTAKSLLEVPPSRSSVLSKTSHGNKVVSHKKK